MEGKLKETLQRIREELTELRDQAETEEGGFLLDCKVDPSDKSVEIEGDTAGLLYLASRLLYLAAKDVRGAHGHFDSWTEAGERGSDPLVVYKWFPE